MRDSKDYATLELPGLMPAAPVEIPPMKRTAASRTRKAALQQVQLELLQPDSPPCHLEQNSTPSERRHEAAATDACHPYLKDHHDQK